jgi:hypothetical protein
MEFESSSSSRSVQIREAEDDEKGEGRRKKG